MYAPPLDFVTYADIDDNIISDCGLLDFEFDEDSTETNGEGICKYHDYDASWGGNVAILPCKEAANMAPLISYWYQNRAPPAKN